ncbi:MAG: hypothetical protein ACRD2A_03160 [Vicinamibacterales bacterium]
MKRVRTLVVWLLGLATLAIAPGAHSAPGGNTTTSASPLGTILLAATATDGSVCAKIDGLEAWQCTPVGVASATPAQIISGLGGSVQWHGFAACDFREKGRGFNPNWSAWEPCRPYSRQGNDSRSWGSGSQPQGGNIVLRWDPIINYETIGMTDCVEIRIVIATDAQAQSNLFGIGLESTSARAVFPAEGQMNVDGVCEGGDPY